MKKTNFQRLTALLLCLIFVLGCFAMPASAAQAGESVASDGKSTGQTAAGMKELLNAITYKEYVVDNANIGPGEEAIVIDAVSDLNKEQTVVDDEERDYIADSDEERAKYDLEEGESCVITNSTDVFAWNVTIPKTGKYSIEIEYYAIEGKATAIERILEINGKVPFSEARYLKLTKNWKNEYIDAIYSGKASNDEVVAAAKDAGIAYEVKDGKVYLKCPEVWTQAKSDFCDKYSIRFMKIDIYNNELRPEAYQAPEWSTYALKDSTGYDTNPFEFVFEEGTTVITLDGENEPMAIKSITLRPVQSIISYEDYLEKYNLKNEPNGSDKIKLEGEYTDSTTDKTIYAVEDRSSAVNSPSASDRTLLNTMGAEKWQIAGQAVTYKFSVNSSGMYDILTRFRQNIVDGIFVNRTLYVYSGEGVAEGEKGYYNGIPFAEAAALTYNYSDEWQVTGLAAQNADGDLKTFNIYFKAGVEYTLEYEVTLGALGEIINDVQTSLDAINNDYLTILKLTGRNPDSNRDYKFTTVMNDEVRDMIRQSMVLDNEKPTEQFELGVAQKLTALAGQKSSHVGTLQKVSALLYEMGTDEDSIAKNLDRLKSYIGSIGTFLSDVKSQPLQVDYMMIQSPEEEQPVAKAGFWKTLVHEVASFFWSFFREYDGMGIMDESTVGNGIEVWLASGRDQSQVIRNLVNNDFSPSSKANGDDIDGSPVDLKLVAAGTLLPSILAGTGPDVYLGLAQGEVINYAIRSAILPIEGMDGFEEHTKTNFNDAAMLVLGIEDIDGVQHYYGLPEAQGFAMMFVRTDILAELDIDIPQTWNEVMEAIPKFQSNNMEIGLTTDYQIFLYQMGGQLFADDGMRINLDSKIGLQAYEKTVTLFTENSLPYIYDAANRFRTGEMPIVIADYTGLYNQLKVFATEIEGSWTFVPLPGMIQEDGSINNQTVSTVAATVMVKGCDTAEDQAKAWEFMKWYTGPQCQTDYSNEMVAIMGPSAKYNTANKIALEALPWTSAEYQQIEQQFNNLASVPNYPGSYIIGRYTQFAFLAAYNNKADPIDELLSYIPTINKEITRKREEFGLETLESGQTLRGKRKLQAQAAMEQLKELGLNDVAKTIKDALNTDDNAVISATAKELLEMINGADYSSDINVKKELDITEFSQEELLYYTSLILSDISTAQEE